LFIMTQQVQPAFIMAVQQSQQAWIMAQQAASPLVQVIVHPLSVISHRHMAIIRSQRQVIMPFIIVQHEHMPPAFMVQRFCIMPQAMASSQVQVIFMPPGHFSIAMVQRGTIIMLATPVGIVPVVPIMPPSMPAVPIIAPRFIIMPTIGVSPVILSDSIDDRMPSSVREGFNEDYREAPSPCKI
jgi:hypothetical protein